MEKDCKDCLYSEESVETGMIVLSCESDNKNCINRFLEEGRFAAKNCIEFTEKLKEEDEKLISNECALAYMIAGKAEFSIVSGKTGVRFHFKLKRKQSKFNNSEYVYFLTSYKSKTPQYAGLIKYDTKDNRYEFIQGNKGALDQSDISVRSLLYVMNNLNNKVISINVKIFHVGRCGRCGRKLTTPESVLTGLGPECSKIKGVKRATV